VGIKTALVIQNEIFNIPTIAVDTHVFRVSNRTGISLANSPENLAKTISSYIPKKYQQHAHHWMILHGRYICTSRNPKCQICKINKYCYYNNISKLK